MIEKDTWYEEQRARFDKDPEYWVEEMRFAFSDEVGRVMEERGITRAELARRLNTSPAYVTRLFRAMFNPTLSTLAKVAVALDARIKLELVPNDEPAKAKPSRQSTARTRRKTRPRSEFVAADGPRKRK